MNTTETTQIAAKCFDCGIIFYTPPEAVWDYYAEGEPIYKCPRCIIIEKSQEEESDPFPFPISAD